MGYESNVTIVMIADEFEKEFNRVLNEDPAREGKKYKIWKEYSSRIRYGLIGDCRVVVIEWNSIKWYKDYEEVAYVANFIENCNTEAVFCRLGDDDSDIERWHYEGDNSPGVLEDADLWVIRDFNLEEIEFVDSFGASSSEESKKELQIELLLDSMEQAKRLLSETVVTNEEMEEIIEQWIRTIKKINK